MKRKKNLVSQVHSAIGSATHWMFRGLISLLTEKLGIDLPPWLERNIAYVCAGLFLLLIGVWHYLPWLPGINFSSFSLDAATLFAIAGLMLSFLAWRAAREASGYAKQAVDDSRAARINIRHTPQYGGFVIANIGKDTAKNINETTGYFSSVPNELLATMGLPPYDPVHTINRSATTIIGLISPLDPSAEIVATFRYENSFGNGFISEFTITNLQKIPVDPPSATCKVSEKSWRYRSDA